MKEPRFTITVVWYHWNCGDGCCSDSGFKVDCYDKEQQKTIYNYDDWEHNRSWGHNVDYCLEDIYRLISKEPIENEDYTMSYWHEDSDGNEYDGYYSGDFEHWK